MSEYLEKSIKIIKGSEFQKSPAVRLLQSKNDWWWEKPSFVLDLSDGITLPNEMSVSHKMTSHATYVGSYGLRYVFGFHHLHAVLSPDGEFDCQEYENYQTRLDLHINNPPPAQYLIPRFARHDGAYSVNFGSLNNKAVTHLNGHTFFGSPIEPANWGMWILNALLSAYSYVAAGQPGRFLCYAPMSWQQNLLTYMGIRPDKIIQQEPWSTYFCEDVALHQYSVVDLVPDALSKFIFKEIVSRCAEGKPKVSGRKIFISRKAFTKKLGGSYRALVNEEQLEAELAARGYDIIAPEILTFPEQVNVFNSAKIVIGLGGAAMFNTVFCEPGTKVVSIEGTSAFALNHARLFGALGHEYGFIFGKENKEDNMYPHNSWTLDINETLRAVSMFES